MANNFQAFCAQNLSHSWFVGRAKILFSGHQWEDRRPSLTLLRSSISLCGGRRKKEDKKCTDAETDPDKLSRIQKRIRIRVDVYIFTDPDPAWVQKKAWIRIRAAPVMGCLASFRGIFTFHSYFLDWIEIAFSEYGFRGWWTARFIWRRCRSTLGAAKYPFPNQNFYLILATIYLNYCENKEKMDFGWLVFKNSKWK